MVYVVTVRKCGEVWNTARFTSDEEAADYMEQVEGYGLDYVAECHAEPIQRR